jgi:hypothetical protein
MSHRANKIKTSKSFELSKMFSRFPGARLPRVRTISVLFPPSRTLTKRRVDSLSSATDFFFRFLYRLRLIGDNSETIYFSSLPVLRKACNWQLCSQTSFFFECISKTIPALN